MPNFRDNVTLKHSKGVKASAVFVQTATISYADNGKVLMTIPAGVAIHSIDVMVTTGFNGTTPTYDLGYSGGDTDGLVDGGTLASAAGQSAFTPPTATVAQWNSSTGGKIVGTFAGGGTNTAGTGVLRVAYFLAP